MHPRLLFEIALVICFGTKGAIDALSMTESYFEYGYSHGLIDKQARDSIEKQWKQCLFRAQESHDLNRAVVRVISLRILPLLCDRAMVGDGEDRLKTVASWMRYSKLQDGPTSTTLPLTSNMTEFLQRMHLSNGFSLATPHSERCMCEEGRRPYTFTHH